MDTFNLQILRLLEGIRTPILDKVMLAITYLGDEVAFLVIALLMLWCIDKRRGYFLLSIGFIGMEINTVLKLFFKIPRPWIKDPTLTVVDGAEATATGYSFPSGHTQNIADTLGSILTTSQRKLVKFLFVIGILAVSFSRMYLGVHTPVDVLASLIIALILLTVGTPIFNFIQKHHWVYIFVLFFLGLIAGAVLFYVNGLIPIDFDEDNLAEGMKVAYTMAGMLVALGISWILDNLFIKYEVKASFKSQVIKMVFGVAIILALRVGLKFIFGIIFVDENVANAVRYFIIAFFAGTIWPLIFRKFE